MSFSARPLRLRTTDTGFDAALRARLQWSADTDAGIEDAVAGILADVQRRGDAAVLEYTNRFDMKAGSMLELQLRRSEL
jgi:histidinol dehydrogenase